MKKIPGLLLIIFTLIILSGNFESARAEVLTLEECIRRDPHGLYKKAQRGEIQNFTGISAPYESPEHPEIILPTHEMNKDQSVNLIVSYLKQHISLNSLN